VQAAAFAVYRLRSDIVIRPDVIENEGQQYGKNHAELQEDCVPNLMIAAKRVTVNDPVQQHAYESCYEPDPEYQPAEFNVRHRGCASSPQKHSRSNFSPDIGTACTRSMRSPPRRCRRKRCAHIDTPKQLTEVERRLFSALTISYKAPLYDTGIPSPDGSRRPFSGAPEQIPGDIRAFAAIGVHELIFDCRGQSIAESIERLQWFATDVIPLVHV
jgi:hypothetical protein